MEGGDEATCSVSLGEVGEKQERAGKDLHGGVPGGVRRDG